MYLLDTNVVSDARKHQAIARWLLALDPATPHLSVITIGEIVRGIEKKRRRDAAAAAHLATWLEGLRSGFASRILNVDAAVATEWGRIGSVRTRSEADGLIAALRSSTA